MPLADVFRVLAAASQEAPSALQSQAVALGKRFASRIRGADAHELASSLARFVEEERLAVHLQLDFEQVQFRCRPGPAVPDLDVDILGRLLAGFAQGVAEGNGLGALPFTAEAQGDAFTLTPDRS